MIDGVDNSSPMKVDLANDTDHYNDNDTDNKFTYWDLVMNYKSMIDTYINNNQNISESDSQLQLDSYLSGLNSLTEDSSYLDSYIKIENFIQNSIIYKLYPSYIINNQGDPILSWDERHVYEIFNNPDPNYYIIANIYIIFQETIKPLVEKKRTWDMRSSKINISAIPPSKRSCHETSTKQVFKQQSLGKVNGGMFTKMIDYHKTYFKSYVDLYYDKLKQLELK